MPVEDWLDNFRCSAAMRVYFNATANPNLAQLGCTWLGIWRPNFEDSYDTLRLPLHNLHVVMFALVSASFSQNYLVSIEFCLSLSVYLICFGSAMVYLKLSLRLVGCPHSFI
jgi:hypothetical protein